jgi:peptidoglycan/LPS O-acetylase OafA/YrhL
MTTPQQTPPGWYPDPSGNGGQRYWDGSQWTDNFSGAATPGFPGTPAAPVAPAAYVAPATRAPAGPLPTLWWGVPAAFALLLLGAIGPWATVDIEVFGQSQSASEGGLDSDGVITLILALIAGGLLLAWRAQRARWQAIVATVAGALSLLIAIVDIADVSGVDDKGIGSVSVGWGLWLTLLGSIVLLVVSVLLMLQSSRKA